jgi:hypothetical protein
MIRSARADPHISSANSNTVEAFSISRSKWRTFGLPSVSGTKSPQTYGTFSENVR